MKYCQGTNDGMIKVMFSKVPIEYNEVLNNKQMISECATVLGSNRFNMWCYESLVYDDTCFSEGWVDHIYNQGNSGEFSDVRYDLSSDLDVLIGPSCV
jgi:hypothetical protein